MRYAVVDVPQEVVLLRTRGCRRAHNDTARSPTCDTGCFAPPQLITPLLQLQVSLLQAREGSIRAGLPSGVMSSTASGHHGSSSREAPHTAHTASAILLCTSVTPQRTVALCRALVSARNGLYCTVHMSISLLFVAAVPV
jgi:hypothetical protein